MIALPYIGAVVLALAALAFVLAPLRQAGKGRWLLAGAVACVLLAVGVGVYLKVGQPRLALRAVSPLSDDMRDPRALIPPLIKRVRQYPSDTQAWFYLGQIYMAARDPEDGAKAYAKVIALTGKGDAALDAAYGEALTMAGAGTVPDEAVAAFTAALAAEPGNARGRFYLGLARMQRGDKPGAIALWQSLLNDTPAGSSLHQMLVDRIAILTSQTGGMPAGGPRAMVAMLAARLKADPHDALGWVRLVRAYHVLGDDDKARAALADARAAFAGNKDAQTAFDTAEKDLK